MAFGPYGTAPVSELMNARMIDEHTHRVFADLRSHGARQVRGRTLRIQEGFFLPRRRVPLRHGRHAGKFRQRIPAPLNQGGAAYNTVSLGPQIGPQLSDLSKNSRADFRKFITVSGGKKREEKVKAGVAFNPQRPTDLGRRFPASTLPSSPCLSSPPLRPRCLPRPIPRWSRGTNFPLPRPTIKASKQTDSYYFYFGSQDQRRAFEIRLRGS